MERQQGSERCRGKKEEKLGGRMEGEKEKARERRRKVNSKLVLELGEIKSRINNAEYLLRNRDLL